MAIIASEEANNKIAPANAIIGFQDSARAPRFGIFNKAYENSPKTVIKPRSVRIEEAKRSSGINAISQRDAAKIAIALAKILITSALFLLAMDFKTFEPLPNNPVNPVVNCFNDPLKLLNADANLSNTFINS